MQVQHFARKRDEDKARDFWMELMTYYTADQLLVLDETAKDHQIVRYEQGIERERERGDLGRRVHGRDGGVLGPQLRDRPLTRALTRAVTEVRYVQLVDREGVGLEDLGRACIRRTILE